MFNRFRKPVRKPHFYRLNLVPLESRDVSATWHVQFVSDNPGSTDATISGSLFVGTADVEADSAADAIAQAISGNVDVSYMGNTHTYHFGSGSTSGANAAFRIVVNGNSATIEMEDLAQMPGTTADYDYNDHSWGFTVTQSSPTIRLSSTDGVEASQTGSFTITRDGNLSSPLTLTYTLSGSAYEGLDFHPIPHSITVPAGQSSVSVAILNFDNGVDDGYDSLTRAVRSGIIPWRY